MPHRHVVRQQYERWPFPEIPARAGIPRAQVWQLNLDWLRDRCRLSPAPSKPRIWLAGCGTVQAHVFSLANPQADILATDLSGESLDIAKGLCQRLGGTAHFERVDLQEPEELPDGPFDHIDCYGVLMYLRDPGATLSNLASRLAVGGTLRVMTYPFFSRRSIFQLRRLARLLGLHDQDPSHPHRFRKLVRRLPRDHPLREAFLTYGDTRSDASVVDAFLNPVDRGFTATGLIDMASQAGLVVGSWLHRPWGQPGPMRESLTLGDCSDSMVLDYLDLWQELRSNLIPCFVRQGESSHEHPAPQAPAVHPLLRPAQPGVGLAHEARLAWSAGSGLKLIDRTAADSLRIPASSMRALRRGGEAIAGLPASERNRLAAAGALLAHRQPGSAEHARAESNTGQGPDWTTPRFELGAGSLNPLHEHLGKAWLADLLHPELGLGTIDAQLSAWQAEADPLEHRRVPFGLTPFGSWQAREAELRPWRERAAGRDTVSSWDEFRLGDEAGKLRALKEAVEGLGLTLPRTLTAGERRELWCLLLSQSELFLDLHAD